MIDLIPFAPFFGHVYLLMDLWLASPTSTFFPKLLFWNTRMLSGGANWGNECGNEYASGSGSAAGQLVASLVCHRRTDGRTDPACQPPTNKEP